MISIIVTTWNKTQFMAACGMACIQSIRAFTDPKDYELIVIETADNYPLWDGHGTLNLKDGIYIKKTMEQDQGNSADMNEGARLAKGEYLCFIENDVILHENWLPNMLYYFEHNLADVVIPCQYHATWDEVQKWKSQTPEEACNPGLEEAGMLMIRKDVFEKTEKWNEKMKKLFMWKAFLQRIGNLRILTTYKTLISHIGGVSYWDLYCNDQDGYKKAKLEEQ
jgi:glycosyltransferase involved in cell wall biosynthesis